RRGTDLSASFLESLQCCLTHYGIQDLEPTPNLREALFWMAKAQQRIGEHLPAVQSILDRRLEQIERIAPESEDCFRSILDRLISASQHRFPDLARQAREVRYQHFERPEFQAREARAYEEAAAHLHALGRPIGGAEREQHMAALVDCPQPLKNFLTHQFESASATGRRAMLETLTRRYYRIRSLEGFTFVSSEGTDFAMAQYDHEGGRKQLFTTFARYDGIGQALGAAAPLLGNVPDEHDVVIDFYVWRPERPHDDDSTAQELRALLAKTASPGCRRWRTSICFPASPTRARATRGCSRWPRCATSARCATKPGAPRDCPASSESWARPWPGCELTIRRAHPSIACT